MARLTRHELVVIPMNHDVDTSDLLGKWLPTSEAADEQQLLLQGENFVSRLTKFLLLSFLPLVQDGADQPKLQEVLAHVQTGYHLLAQSSAASAREKIVQVCNVVKTLLQGLDLAQVRFHVSLINCCDGTCLISSFHCRTC